LNSAIGFFRSQREIFENPPNTGGMRKSFLRFIVGAAILCGTTVLCPAQTYTGYANSSGGYRFFNSSGAYQGYTAPNSSGGYNYYAPNGTVASSSASSLGGGYRYFNGQGYFQGSSTPVNNGAVSYYGR
jgi:hypothetical protein